MGSAKSHQLTRFVEGEVSWQSYPLVSIWHWGVAQRNGRQEPLNMPMGSRRIFILITAERSELISRKGFTTSA